MKEIYVICQERGPDDWRVLETLFELDRAKEIARIGANLMPDECITIRRATIGEVIAC